jgi:two-component system phosphate regulon response regulator OmpR
MSVGSAKSHDDKPHVLIIDDDDRLRSLIGRFLADHGFRVTPASSAEEARRRLAGMMFDLLVVDIMMPGESGLDLVRSLKETAPGNPPCLMLTAMGEPGHRLHGLESGADDYMTKPFEPLELVLRINKILTRAERLRLTEQPAANSAHFGPHLFDLARQQLITGGRRQHLTSAEKDLLGCFCEHPRETLSRERLSDMLGGQMEGRSIDVAVARLRRKIEPNPGKPIYLLTSRGRGWLLETDLTGHHQERS